MELTMRSVRQILCCLLPLVGVATAGCDGGAAVEGVGSGKARLVLTSQGASPATLHVTATDDATGSLVIDRTIALNAGTSSVLDVPLDAAAYTLHVDAARHVAGAVTREGTDAHADVLADQTKEIRFTARDDGSVSVIVDGAPTIHGIDVKPATDGTSTGAVDPAVITVDASDPEGGNLRFFWSGLGIDGAMEGLSSLSLSSLTAPTFRSEQVVHLVVQDSAGATTVAGIAFLRSPTCLVCGTSVVQLGAPAGDGDLASACLDVRAQCNAACDDAWPIDPMKGAGDVACLKSCGLVLASCLAG
jgi:hypothetical protein